MRGSLRRTRSRKAPDLSLGAFDRGGRSVFPGSQDKLWRDHWVDSELKEEWLERLDEIPEIAVVGTCTGHPFHAIGPGQWAEDDGPQISYRPLTEEALSDLPEIFGNLLFYFQPGEVPSRNHFQEMFEDSSAIGYVISSPEERLFRLIVVTPEVVSIRSIKPRSEMTGYEFDSWWETIIGGLETLKR